MRVRDDARPSQRSDWTTSLDVALEEIDHNMSSSIATDFVFSIR
jgi:hypothetical protein